MSEKFTTAAKFWAGLIGSIATALLATTAPDTPAFKVLTVIVAIAGAVAVYLVPNAPKQVDEDEETHDDEDFDEPYNPDATESKAAIFRSVSVAQETAPEAVETGHPVKHD